MAGSPFDRLIASAHEARLQIGRQRATVLLLKAECLLAKVRGEPFDIVWPDYIGGPSCPRLRAADAVLAEAIRLDRTPRR